VTVPYEYGRRMTKKRKAVRRRDRKGEGMLFQRGRIRWYKAQDGQRVSTGTTLESEAVDFKIRKLAEPRIDQPHIKTPVPKATVNEPLDGCLAYMRRKNRPSAEDLEGVVKIHARSNFRIAPGPSKTVRRDGSQRCRRHAREISL